MKCFVSAMCINHGRAVGEAEINAYGNLPKWNIRLWCGCSSMANDSDVEYLHGFANRNLAHELTATESFAVFTEMESIGFEPWKKPFEKIKLIKMLNIRLNNLRAAKASVEFEMYRIWFSKKRGIDLQPVFEPARLVNAFFPHFKPTPSMTKIVPGELTPQGRLRTVCPCGCAHELEVELPPNAPKVVTVGIPEMNFDDEEEDAQQKMSPIARIVATQKEPFDPAECENCNLTPCVVIGGGVHYTVYECPNCGSRYTTPKK